MRDSSLRLVILVFLIAAELLAISLFFDAQVLLEGGGGSLVWLGYAGYGAKILVAGIVAFLIALGPRLKSWHNEFRNAAAQHRYMLSLSLHVCAFLGFFYVTSLIFSGSSAGGLPAAGLSLVWAALLVALVAFWLSTTAPWRFWATFVGREKLTFGFAAIVAFLASGFALVTRDLWDPLSGITLDWAAALLQLFSADIVVDRTSRVLGTGDFVVQVAAACSGYEGIGLVTIFTSLYLVVFRDEFRFPRALLLLPIGIVIIWLFNVVRIAALIAIGAEWSPELALEGFHSQAGWISFILVATGILLLAHNSSFSRVSEHAATRQPINYRMALLIPLVVLLATTLLTAAMSITVDWWYPLRVVCTAAALILLWKHFSVIRFRVTWIPVATGVLVFAAWLALVPEDSVSSAKSAAELEQISSGALGVWLLFRIVGAVIIVPLAEELAFRGYLFELLRPNDKPDDADRTPWFALLVSSVLFGLLHTAWVAGMLAGIAYGAMRCYRGSIGDAFIAHATTNLLLSVYVLSTGRWSLW